MNSTANSAENNAENDSASSTGMRAAGSGSRSGSRSGWSTPEGGATGPQLLCVGNLTIDETVTPGREPTESVGGDALFAALAARLAGGSPTLLAPIGVDATAALLGAIRLAGTDPATLPVRSAPTVRNVIHYDAHGGRVWHLLLGEEHFEDLSVQPADVAATALAADGVLLSAMALRAQLALAAWLRPRTEATVYFDPQEDYIAGNESDLLAAVAACDVFLPSEVEAVALAGTTDLTAAAAMFLACGPSTVVVKRAAAGCLVATRQHPEPVAVPADAVDPVDSTGAGDAFCGAFAATHLRTGDPIAAARAGAAAARIAVGGHGVDGLLTALAPAGPGISPGMDPRTDLRTNLRPDLGMGPEASAGPSMGTGVGADVGSGKAPGVATSAGPGAGPGAGPSMRMRTAASR